MSRRFRVLGTLFLLLVAAVIAALESRAFDRLVFPAHHLDWTIVSDAAAAYTGFYYEPFDPSIDGALFPFPDRSWLEVRVRTAPSESDVGTGRHVALRALLTPPPAYWPARLHPFAPTPQMRAVMDAHPKLAGRHLVQWDLSAFANPSWVPFKEEGEQAGVTGLDAQATRGGSALSLRIPAAWGVLVFWQQPDGGRVRITSGRRAEERDLSEQPLTWALVPISARGHRPYETAEASEREYTATFNGTDRVHFMPVVSKTATVSYLLSLSLDGKPMNLGEALQWPRGPGLTIAPDANGLRVVSQAKDAWLQLPESLTRRSALRRFTSWAAGTILLGVVFLTLARLVHGLYRSGQWAAPTTPRLGFAWIPLILVALILHLSYYSLAKPWVAGAGAYYYKVAEHLCDYLSSGIIYFYRTPAHIIYLWGLRQLGAERESIALIQHLLSCVSVTLIWHVSRRLGLSNPLALIVALAVACHPRLHFFANTLWSETLTLFLLLVCAELFLASSRRAWWPLAAGVSCACLALCRPQYLFVIALAPPLYLLRPGRSLAYRIRELALCVLGFIVPMSPWVAYNIARNVPGVAMSHAQVACYYFAPEIPGVRRTIDAYGGSRKNTTFVRGLDLPPLRLDSSWEDVRAFHATIRERVRQQSRWQHELYRRYPRGMLGKMCAIYGYLAGWAPMPQDVFIPDIRHAITRKIRFRDDLTDTETWRVRVNDWFSDAYPRVVPVVYALAWLGALCALWWRRIDWLLVTALGLGNTLLIPLILLHSRRYILPTEPFVFLLAAFAIQAAILLVQRAWPRARTKT